MKLKAYEFLIRQLRNRLSDLVDPAMGGDADEIDKWFVQLLSGATALITKSMEELLRLRPSPQERPPGTSANFESILGECGQHLVNEELCAQLYAFAQRRGWQLSSGPQSNSDKIDLPRTLALIGLHFCSGTAAYYAVQVLKNQADAWKQLCDWLARTHGHLLKGDEPLGQPTLEGLRGRGLTESHVVEQAIERLAITIDQFKASPEVLEHVNWWLNGQRSTNAIRIRQIPIVSVQTKAATNEDELLPILGTLKLELLVGAGTGLIEAPTLWNCPRTTQFNETVQQAYEAAWPDPTGFALLFPFHPE